MFYIKWGHSTCIGVTSSVVQRLPLSAIDRTFTSLVWVHHCAIQSDALLSRQQYSWFYYLIYSIFSSSVVLTQLSWKLSAFFCRGLILVTYNLFNSWITRNCHFFYILLTWLIVCFNNLKKILVYLIVTSSCIVTKKRIWDIFIKNGTVTSWINNI